MNYESLETKLKERGFKLTKQRKDIFDYLVANKDKHLSAEEIYDAIKKKKPGIGLATVYRTMQLFTDIKVSVRNDFEQGKSRYELNIDGDFHNHHHLVCSICNKIIEVNEDLMDELEKQIEDKYEFEIVNHDLKLFGYCKECRDKK